MEIVEINIPRSIDLKNIVKNDDDDTKYILQTIDIYDKVTISQNLKQQGIFIKSKNELNDEVKDNIKKIINIFSQYTNKEINSLTIDIEKNKINILETNYNILAGILLGLNILFNNYLSLNELIYLVKEIDSLIAYYLVCGYKKIDINNKSYSIGDNIFNKYFILYDVDKKDLLKVKEYILKYNIAFDYSNDFYFIAIKNGDSLKIPISIKKEFHNLKMIKCENIKKEKVLKKYLNYFE